MGELREEIERKLAIRNFARGNMDISGTEEIKVANAKYLTNELENLKRNIDQAQKYVVQYEYWELKSNRKVIGPVIIFIRKLLRKIQHIVMGWFINGVLEHQTHYNQESLRLIRYIDHVLEVQVKECSHMRALIEKQSLEIDKLEAELKRQREEYLIMFQYHGNR